MYRLFFASFQIFRGIASPPVLFAGFLCFALTLCTAVTAQARQSEIFVPREEGESTMQLEKRALDEGFAQAVFEEAMEILPGELQMLRRDLLRSFLDPRAGNYVIRYNQLRQEASSEGIHLSLEVTVNRQALKEMLQRIGVFYTSTSFIPYTLELSGVAPEAWEEVSSLQMLSGLTALPGTSPVLKLELDERGIWTGVLEAESKSWRDRHKKLENLWLKLWGNYFTRTEAAAASFNRMVLSVSGFITPEGPQSLDKELQSWDQAVESAQLMDISLEGGAVTARWEIKSLSRSNLEELLYNNLPMRGLTFVLDSPEGQSP